MFLVANHTTSIETLFTGLPNDTTSRKATILARLEYLEFHIVLGPHVCSFAQVGFSTYLSFWMLALGS